jgi:hypothetical protein
VTAATPFSEREPLGRSSTTSPPAASSARRHLSHEQTSREEVNGGPQADTGGRALTLQPGIVGAARARLLVFVLTSPPLADAWRNPADLERFRIGAGTIPAFGR